MFFKTLKKQFSLNAKNLVGWRTKRKILVISVDDYGNVRLDSKVARERMDRNGLKVHNRFDALDTLETREDLELLFDTLSSVRDKAGRHAIMTLFAVPCNINYERIAESGYREYHYELLPETYRKKSDLDPNSYNGTWDLWNEGMREGLIVPQFHGREHVNLKVFIEKLQNEDHELLTCLRNRSFTSITESGYTTISPMAAYDFWEFEENQQFHSVIEDGLNQFETVFGCRAENFTPPVYNAHPILYKTLVKGGIRFVDTAMLTKEHQGLGNYQKKINYTGKKTAEGLCMMVRNVVFEPTSDRRVDWPSYAMKQIEAAFRWNRPAILSSHRVNFCGHIEPENRREGLSALKILLNKVVERWPDIEFMAANKLGELIHSKKS